MPPQLRVYQRDLLHTGMWIPGHRPAAEVTRPGGIDWSTSRTFLSVMVNHPGRAIHSTRRSSKVRASSRYPQFCFSSCTALFEVIIMRWTEWGEAGVCSGEEKRITEGRSPPPTKFPLGWRGNVKTNHIEKERPQSSPIEKERPQSSRERVLAVLHSTRKSRHVLQSSVTWCALKWNSPYALVELRFL